LGLSVIDYTEFIHHRISLKPEVGLSLNGMVDLTYTYSIAPGQYSFGFSDHALCVRWMFGA
jgi:hypothetical protein